MVSGVKNKQNVKKKFYDPCDEVASSLTSSHLGGCKQIIQFVEQLVHAKCHKVATLTRMRGTSGVYEEFNARLFLLLRRRSE